jgi:hypothetical protein
VSWWTAAHFPNPAQGFRSYAPFDLTCDGLSIHLGENQLSVRGASLDAVLAKLEADGEYGKVLQGFYDSKPGSGYDFWAGGASTFRGYIPLVHIPSRTDYYKDSDLLLSVVDNHLELGIARKSGDEGLTDSRDIVIGIKVDNGPMTPLLFENDITSVQLPETGTLDLFVKQYGAEKLDFGQKDDILVAYVSFNAAAKTISIFHTAPFPAQ